MGSASCRDQPISTAYTHTPALQSRAGDGWRNNLRANSPKTSCCCSVTKSCSTLCNHVECSTPGFPVLHCLPEFAQTYVHWVSDTIEPSHPLSPLLLLPSIFPSIRVFSNEEKMTLHIRWPKYCRSSISPSSEYAGLISFGLMVLISLQSKGLSRVFSRITVQKHQFFGTQSSLCPTLTHVHFQ